MKTLENLKQRLLALPSLREGRQHEARYAAFLAKTTTAKDNLIRASLAAEHGGAVLPSAGYGETRRSIKTGATIASRLKEKLDADPAVVADTNIDKSFTRLCENADSTLKGCQTIWQESLQAKIKDWEAIAEVVVKLGDEEEAKSLKAQARLLEDSNRFPPRGQNEAKADQTGRL